MELLKSQKKQLSLLIETRSMEPASFTWSTDSESYQEETPIIRYENSDFYFAFIFEGSHWRCVYSPGRDVHVETSGLMSWSTLLQIFEGWTIFLKREIETDDPWDLLEKYKPNNSDELSFLGGESKFSYQEVESITTAINQLKGYAIKEFALDEQNSKILTEKLNLLIEKAKKYDRIDWKNIFVGTLINLAVTLSLSPEQAHIMWRYAKECFHVVKLLMPA